VWPQFRDIVSPRRHGQEHNEKLHDLYCSYTILCYKIKDDIDEACSTHGSDNKRYRILVENLNRDYVRPRLRWEDNIKLILDRHGVWTGFTWLNIGTVVDSCEYVMKLPDL
jgi:hypothetical protein